MTKKRIARIKTFFRPKTIILYLIISLTVFSCKTNDESLPPPTGLSFEIKTKETGNPSESHKLSVDEQQNNYYLKSDDTLPLEIKIHTTGVENGAKQIKICLTATEDVNFNLQGFLSLKNTKFEDASFYLPGFWYRKNLRSSPGAPSARYGKAWTVREDRLSAPLTAVFDHSDGKSLSITRTDDISRDALMPYKKGDVIIKGITDMGFVGFDGRSEDVKLTFGYPFAENPKTYIRKLTLAPPVTAFVQLQKGEKKIISWEIREFNSEDYSAFIENTWNNSYDLFKPENLDPKRTDNEIKEVLSEYFKQSYTDDYELVGFSGVHLHIDSCSERALLEIGFVGRVLLNAYNAVELGYANEDVEMLRMGHKIYDTYKENGFIPQGYLREVVDFKHGRETEIYSIRRQSEGLFALMQYLSLEKKHRREHLELEEKAIQLLDKIVALQQDGFFPRKFNADGEIVDNAGGSTSTAVIPLLMGYKYFNNEQYLESAQLAAEYIEKEIIDKGDYFSSTLDANCEDKEASIYASSAMYYLGLLTKGEESKHYYELAEKAAYFAVSWYYLWDVPFAPGQMLGDLGFKTRGWGNVSVENNHVDVYIFDFADVMKHLSDMNGNPRLKEMAKLIKSSMREQLLPVEDRLCGVGKVGYYPEVVQHTNWDYGQFGKGYYNNIFAPGWTVTSLWELLSEDRLHNYFSEL